jgi:hypothetical protein
MTSIFEMIDARYFDAIAAYVAYFFSRYVGNDVQLLCGSVLDTPFMKTFTLFCVLYLAGGKNVKIALTMTIVFLLFQFFLSKNQNCGPYTDKTNVNPSKLNIENTSWVRIV